MRVPAHVLALLLTCAVVSACGRDSIAKTLPQGLQTKDSNKPVGNAEGDCPVTLPPDPPYLPPPPFPAEPPFGEAFWYGTDELWTAIPQDGSWDQLAQGEKVFWWNEGYDWNLEPMPDLYVTAIRLDGELPIYQASHATNASNPEDIQSAMLVGVQLPTQGCWEISGNYKGDELSFVVRVGP